MVLEPDERVAETDRALNRVRGLGPGVPQPGSRHHVDGRRHLIDEVEVRGADLMSPAVANARAVARHRTEPADFAVRPRLLTPRYDIRAAGRAARIPPRIGYRVVNALGRIVHRYVERAIKALEESVEFLLQGRHFLRGCLAGRRGRGRSCRRNRRRSLLGRQRIDLLLQLLHLLLHDAHLFLQRLGLIIVRKSDATNSDGSSACGKRHQHRLCQSRFKHCVNPHERVCLTLSRRHSCPLTSCQPD